MAKAEGVFYLDIFEMCVSVVDCTLAPWILLWFSLHCSVWETGGRGVISLLSITNKTITQAGPHKYCFLIQSSTYQGRSLNSTQSEAQGWIDPFDSALGWMHVSDGLWLTNVSAAFSFCCLWVLFMDFPYICSTLKTNHTTLHILIALVKMAFIAVTSVTDAPQSEY